MDATRSRFRTVLLVEDSDIDAHLTCTVLHGCHSEIVVNLVSTAEEALMDVRKWPYDLVICDFCLPGMDGLSFLTQVKTIRSNLPVILLTGYPSQELEAQIIHHGSCTYLSKAVDGQTLAKIVLETLGLQESGVPTRAHGHSYLC